MDQIDAETIAMHTDQNYENDETCQKRDREDESEPKDMMMDLEPFQDRDMMEPGQKRGRIIEPERREIVRQIPAVCPKCSVLRNLYRDLCTYNVQYGLSKKHQKRLFLLVWYIEQETGCKEKCVSKALRDLDMKWKQEEVAGPDRDFCNLLTLASDNKAFSLFDKVWVFVTLFCESLKDG